jgi:hypothetical protein
VQAVRTLWQSKRNVGGGSDKPAQLFQVGLFLAAVDCQVWGQAVRLGGSKGHSTALFRTRVRGFASSDMPRLASKPAFGLGLRNDCLM